MDRRKWCVCGYDEKSVERIVSLGGVAPYTALLLSARGITDPETVRGFCSGEGGLCDPFLLPDMDKAVEAIGESLDMGEKIAVYGDYDADGLTATAVLYTYLLSQGADVCYYVPDRNTEGYGMNTAAIDKIFNDGVKLIITVDNGISAFEEAEYISSLGMKLVVTDHHTVSEKLPRALAVVNPHRKDSACPFADWAGVGVAFKLVCALEGEESEYMLDEYAQLVTVGTIADVVPLTGENRYIVQRGLEMMNSEPMACIEAMKEAADYGEKQLNATSVAFTLVPRINAMGRIAAVKPVLELLLENGDIMHYAEMLNDCNRERQRIEQEILSDVTEIAEKHPELVKQPIIVIENEGWHAGVVGIVAARMVEKYAKPCLIISCDGDDAKGSGRSVEGFSLYDALCSAKEYLTHFGGHTLAVGFSLKKSDIPAFREKINQYAETVDMPFARLNIDCRLRPEALNLSVLSAFNALEPFGAGNPQPTVGIFGVTLTSVQPIGGGKHLRLGFTKKGCSFNALRFGVSEDKFQYEPGDVLDLAVKLEENEFRGEKSVSVQIKGIRPSGRDDDGFLTGISLFEKIMRGGEITRQEALTACPDRGFVSTVYKTVRNLKTKQADLDKICMYTGTDTASTCRTLVACEALYELGILKKNGEGNPVLPDVTVKNNLDNSSLLLMLKNRAGA